MFDITKGYRKNRLINAIKIFFIKRSKYHPYWHRLNKIDQLTVQETSGMSIGQFKARYRQPDWCDYPDALEGIMGCWKLWYRDAHSKYDCRYCDMVIKK